MIIKIAVICAYPKFNPGMMSVDFSFDHIVSNIKEQIEFTRFCVDQDYDLSYRDLNLKYINLESVNQLNDFDKIIIWGDFLTWYNYGHYDWLQRQNKKNKKLLNDELIDKWYSCMLFENRKDLQQKTIIFGTTLYGVNSLQLTDQRYYNALTNLYDNSILVLMRDVYSCHFLSEISKNKKIGYGSDCALFLDTNEFYCCQSTKNKKYIAYSFGRSNCNAELIHIAKQLSLKLDLELVNVNWLDKSGIDGLLKKICLIKNSEFLLTDIYHCSITGIREKIPVVCFGKGASVPNKSLDDKKKEIFFYQSFLSQNYIFVETVFNALINNIELEKLITKILNVINDKKSNEFAFNLINKRVKLSKEILISHILN